MTSKTSSPKPARAKTTKKVSSPSVACVAGSLDKALVSEETIDVTFKPVKTEDVMSKKDTASQVTDKVTNYLKGLWTWAKKPVTDYIPEGCLKKVPENVQPLLTKVPVGGVVGLALYFVYRRHAKKETKA